MTETSILRDGVAALAVAAAVLIEDAHVGLLSTSTTVDGQATALQALGADLTALAGAAAVPARHNARGAARVASEI